MTENAMQKVWDIPTRVFHWAIALTIVYAWFAIEVAEDMDQHFWAGYTALALIAFRLAWGLLGSTYARFNSMCYSWDEIKRYAKSLPSRQAKPYAGHSPVGSVAVLLMLAMITLQATTGLFANDGEFVEGPLAARVSAAVSDALTEIHEANGEALLIIAGLHVAAVFFYLLYKRENLISPMFTGMKSLPAPTPFKPAPLWLAIVLLLLSVALVAYIDSFSPF